MGKRATAPRCEAMRARGTGSVYQRPGRAAWYIKDYDRNGRPHRESCGSEARSDAERLLKKRLAEVASGRRLVGSALERTTFEDLERLITDAYRVQRRKSLDSVLQSFRALRRGGFGSIRACDIGHDELQHYAADRLSKCMPATVRRELALLHRAFVLAHRAGKVALVPPFPTIGVDNARSGFFEPDEWQSIREHLASLYQNVGDFAYLMGWRVMEILGLAGPMSISKRLREAAEPQDQERAPAFVPVRCVAGVEHLARSAPCADGCDATGERANHPARLP